MRTRRGAGLLFPLYLAIWAVALFLRFWFQLWALVEMRVVTIEVEDACDQTAGEFAYLLAQGVQAACGENEVTRNSRVALICGGAQSVLNAPTIVVYFCKQHAGCVPTIVPRSPEEID